LKRCLFKRPRKGPEVLTRRIEEQFAALESDSERDRETETERERERERVIRIFPSGVPKRMIDAGPSSEKATREC